MNVLTALNTAFAAATDAAFEYSSSAIWECNLKDSVEKPQVFWARSFTFINSISSVGGKTKALVNVFFLKPNLFTDTQPEQEPLLSDMLDAANAWYAALESTSLQPTVKEVRFEDVYKFLDINFAGWNTNAIIEFNTPC